MEELNSRAREYAKRHPEYIREDADILKTDNTPRRGAKVGNQNARKNMPAFTVPTNVVKKPTHNIDTDKPERSSRTNALIRSALRARWLYFINNSANANKTVNQARADFTHELFTELGI